MKTVIEMAREAGIDEWETGSDTARTASQTRRLNRLERFAALVRAEEREKAAKKIEWYIGNNQEWFERTPEGLAEEIRGEK